MTDQEIQEYLSRDLDEHDLCSMKHRDIQPLLKELLSYRALRLLPCWRVWITDITPQGWHWVAAFPSKAEAELYRALHSEPGWLVLPGNEQPSLTAR